MDQKKMYIVVRKDLDPTYRMVQGAHGLAQFAIDYPELFEEWNNRTIIFLEVKHEGYLFILANNLTHSGKEFVAFYEEDIDGECTSIACYNDGEMFKKYNMIK